MLADNAKEPPRLGPKTRSGGSVATLISTSSRLRCFHRWKRLCA